jgi:hypothetical protein
MSQPTIGHKKPSKEAIIRELWSRGLLEYKMHAVQKDMYSLYKAAKPNSTSVWLLARQSGKTYGLALIAIIEAIKNPRSIIKFMTDTKIHMEDVLIPIMEQVMEDCPEDLKPKYNKQRFRYTFPNGSQIQLAGSDGGSAERLRGQKSLLVIVDEAGFCTDLRKIVQTILLPTTTHTGGKLILSSTPPEEPDHDFNGYVEAAEVEGNLTKKTVFDNPLLNQEQIHNIIARYPGGVNDVDFKREYMCEMLKNFSKSVFPEVDKELLAKIVREHPKPSFYTPYVSMDIGFKDLTVVLFGYYDFRAGKLIIEDEIVKRGEELHLEKFSHEILKKEEYLWTNILTNEKTDPKVRVSDIEPIVTQEIYRHSDNLLYFTPISKERGYKQPLINQIRMMLVAGQIVINPRCSTLIRHLQNCRWKDNSRDEFARSLGENAHYDAADALIYMVKVVDFTHNPYPAYPGVSQATHYIKPGVRIDGRSNNSVEIFKSIYGRKK